MYKIVDMNWERVNLIITLNKIIEKDCYLVTNNNKYNIDYDKEKIKINITNIPEGKAIEEGCWYIEINDEKVKLDSNMLYKLDDKSRIFKYKGNTYALLITFEINSDFIFMINSNYVMKNNKYKKMFRIVEGTTLMQKIKILFKILFIYFGKIFYKIINILLYRKNNILFLSENSNKLQSNLKAYYENAQTNLKKSIFCKNIYNTKNRILIQLMELIKISRSKYIIIDNYVSLLTILPISKRQKIIQLWHAGVGFKAVGYARFGKKGSPHPFISSHRKYNYAFIDNKELLNIYKEVFGNRKEIFTVSGMPRLNDYLDNNKITETVNKIETSFPIIKNKKIILFSPTYRGNSASDAYYDYSQIDIDKIYNFCEENNFIFIIKMHPFIRNKISIKKEYKNRILDLSYYDINKLIYISDIMITDYSSCAYEYSFFNRPLIFYRYDKDIYEYLRPIHTLDKFSKEQYEVKNFNELLKTLESLKNIDIKNRFKNKRMRNIESCDIISETIFKGEK